MVWSLGVLGRRSFALSVAVLAVCGWLVSAGAAFASKGVERVVAVSGLSGGVAVDRADGDVWVQLPFSDQLERYDAAGVLQGTVGGSGVGEGQFGFGFDFAQVATDSAGNVYVADAANNRVQVFDSDGVFVRMWGWGVADGSSVLQVCASGCQAGLAGAGAGQLNGPRGIAIDPSSGDVFVADTLNGRVLRFGAGGVLVDEISSPGTDNGQLNVPSRVAVDSAGRLYVRDLNASFAPRVQVFGPAGGFVSVFGAGVLSSADDVAVDPVSGVVYVAGSLSDGRSGVVALDANANVLDVHGQGVGFFATGLALGGGGEIFVSEGFANRVLVLDDVAAPTVSIGAVDGVGPDAAAFHGLVDPQGSQAGYRFEYSVDGVSWTAVPATDVDVGSGTGDVAVSQTATGLVPNTAYRVRLVATKPLGAGSAVSDEVTFSTDPVGPQAQTSGAQAGVTTARVAGRVHPHNSPTSYYFEYSIQPDLSGAVSVPGSQDADAGQANDWVDVSQPLTGLQANTVYYYRPVATNQVATVTGQIHTFKTLPALPAPPPGRGYELVSGGDKGALSVNQPDGGRAISPDGRSAQYSTTGAPDDVQANPGAGLVRYATRNPNTGWSSQAIDPPRLANGVDPYGAVLDFSGDLTQGLIGSALALAPGGVQGARNLYLHNNTTVGGGYRTVTAQPGPTDPAPTGVSVDKQTVAFANQVPQTADAVDPNYLYPYIWHDGTVTLAGILPDPDGPGPLEGEPAPFGALPGAGLGRGTTERALSGDGKRLVFHARTAADDTSLSDSFAGQLYVREDDHVNPPRTIHVNASQRTTTPDPAGPLPALYWSAEAKHGSKVLFTSCEKLTDNATAADPGGFSACNATDVSAVTQAGSGGRDLYLFDVDSGQLKDLTTADSAGADVRGVLGASEDLSSIYFVASGVLAVGGRLGEANLYLYRDGAVRYIATLTGDDGAAWSATPRREALGNNRERASRVSADGGFAAFVSRAPLTGFDNRGPGCGGGRCGEVFRYDAANDRLACVSCPSDGTAPSGDASLFKLFGTTDSALELPRNLGVDGRVFFESPDALAGADVNGKRDVYGWEGGAVSLISGGRSGEDSYFVDATPDGHDVLFRTHERLVGADRDDVADVYDARIDGGFPETPPPAPCQGDECRGGLSSPPDVDSPGSGQTTDGEGSSPSFRIGTFGAGQRALLAKGKRAVLRVRVSQAGKLTITGRAKVGRRAVTVAHATKRATRAGTIEVGVRLSRQARRQLMSRHKLAVAFSVRFSGVAQPRTLRVALERKGR